MSDKEAKRRKIIKQVMRKAWVTFRRCMLTWSTCLRIAWKTVRCLLTVYHSKVKGTTFNNRQRLLRRLSLYPINKITLRIERELGNLFDPNAIRIIAKVKGKGEADIGYISKELALDLAPIIDLGNTILIMIDSITGSNRSGGFLGVNFNYIVIQKRISNKSAQI